MPRNGSGTFNRIYNWQQDAANNIRIRADRMDAEMDGMATALTNSIAKDGQTPVTQDLPMTTRKHTNVGDADQRDQYAVVGQIQDGAYAWGGTDTGAADAYEITTSPVTTAYAAGQVFRFIVGAGNTNTGAATLNVNALGAKSIKTSGSDPQAGRLVAGRTYDVVYDGTNFVLAGGTAAQVNTGNNPGTATILGVAEQAQHDDPQFVSRLARVDRLYAAPGWHHVETRKITSAVSSAVIDLPTEFNIFRFDIVNLNSSGEMKIGCRVSYNGGSSYDNGAADYRFALSFTGGGGGSVDSNQIELSNTASSDSGTIFAVDGSYIANLDGGRFRISGHYTCQSTVAGLNWVTGVAGGCRTTSGVPTNLIFFNAVDGTVLVQGTIVVSGARG